ncbi:hypothetical protein [Marinifilum caeruleilacunae]|uniref:Lipoprotein n=1 Tax=Marinifilum caeruleilacunae TaxID=2499076 RepID=A0ABX1WRI7_9BACT|nr:hypothetical protein [Marinifilum caeruleilacunae]NOU58691.1 hypothetical protein [Marinifilum caeruleilacunae]
MKTYFPYQLKYVGAFLVLTAIVLSCIGNVDDFMRGFLGVEEGVEFSEAINASSEELDQTLSYTPYFTTEEKSVYLDWSLLLSIAGFTLYLFSKEKSEDEFYQQLRGKCLTQALFITWIITGLIYWLRPAYELEGFYILQLHLIFYTFLYYYNKYSKYAIA